MPSAHQEIAEIKRYFREFLERRNARRSAAQAEHALSDQHESRALIIATQRPRPVQTGLEQQVHALQEELTRCRAALRRRGKENERQQKVLIQICEQLSNASEWMDEPDRRAPVEFENMQRKLRRGSEFVKKLRASLETWLGYDESNDEARASDILEQQRTLITARMETAMRHSSPASPKRAPSIVLDTQDDEMDLCS